MLRQGFWHTCAWSASLSTGTDQDTAAVRDDILTIQNNHFVLPRPMDLTMAMALGATLSDARIASPTMRQIFNPHIRPINVSALPGNNTNLWILDHSPFVIPPWEEIQTLLTCAPAMTEQDTVVANLRLAYEPCPAGNVYPWKWTSTTAAVANTWTTLAVTFADTLPIGTYAVVGTEHFSTNAQAHRIIFPDQVYRPGMPSYASAGQRLPYAISMYQFGCAGYFRSNAVPTFQVLVNGTDASHTGYLHIVRVSDTVM